MAITIFAAAMATGCGKTKDSNQGETAGKATEGKSKVPTLTINEADWVEKNLSEVSPMVHITMKVPADATMEKNGNGGVDIKLADHYMITVGNLAVGSVKSGLEWAESSSTGDSSYKDGTKIQEDESGFVYTYQMNDEANGLTYHPESHFYHFVEKEGAVYNINDSKPMDAFLTDGAAYSPELAKQVYGIVKASAKAN